MFSRRSMVKTGFATFASMAGTIPLSSLAQAGTPEAVDASVAMLFSQGLPELPEASDGEVEVVLSGHGDGRAVGFIVHNASDAAVGLENATGIALLTDASQLETVGRGNMAPSILNPGEYALGFVRFEDDVPGDAELELEVETEEPGSGNIELVDVPVTEVNFDDNRLDGEIFNDTDKVASETVGVNGIFFGDDGEIVGWGRGYLTLDVDPGETGRFRVRDTFGEVTDSWAFAASGWAG